METAKLLKDQKVVARQSNKTLGLTPIVFSVTSVQGRNCIIEDPKGRKYKVPTDKLQRA